VRFLKVSQCLSQKLLVHQRDTGIILACGCHTGLPGVGRPSMHGQQK
jgi:hypothetical protein